MTVGCELSGEGDEEERKFAVFVPPVASGRLSQVSCMISATNQRAAI